MSKKIMLVYLSSLLLVVYLVYSYKDWPLWPYDQAQVSHKMDHTKGYTPLYFHKAKFLYIHTLHLPEEVPPTPEVSDSLQWLDY